MKKYFGHFLKRSGTMNVFLQGDLFQKVFFGFFYKKQMLRFFIAKSLHLSSHPQKDSNEEFRWRNQSFLYQRIGFGAVCLLAKPSHQKERR